MRFAFTALKLAHYGRLVERRVRTGEWFFMTTITGRLTLCDSCAATAGVSGAAGSMAQPLRQALAARR